MNTTDEQTADSFVASYWRLRAVAELIVASRQANQAAFGVLATGPFLSSGARPLRPGRPLGSIDPGPLAMLSLRISARDSDATAMPDLEDLADEEHLRLASLFASTPDDIPNDYAERVGLLDELFIQTGSAAINGDPYSRAENYQVLGRTVLGLTRTIVDLARDPEIIAIALTILLHIKRTKATPQLLARLPIHKIFVEVDKLALNLPPDIMPPTPQLPPLSLGPRDRQACGELLELGTGLARAAGLVAFIGRHDLSPQHYLDLATEALAGRRHAASTVAKIRREALPFLTRAISQRPLLRPVAGETLAILKPRDPTPAEVFGGFFASRDDGPNRFRRHQPSPFGFKGQ